MIDYAAYRAKLEAAIARRRQAERAKHEPDEKPRCEHEFKRYRQTLPTTNHRYQGGDAYFVLLACDRCQEKRTTDYVIAR